MKNIASSLIVAVFVVAALFGLYAPFMGMGHDMGCPFAVQSAVCMAPLEHVTHWQVTFAAVVAELLVLCALVFVFLARTGLFRPGQRQYERYRVYRQVPRRPTLFQELFSQGLLNPKVPLISGVSLSLANQTQWKKTQTLSLSRS